MNERCHICGAEMSHENSEICKNFRVQRARRTSTSVRHQQSLKDTMLRYHGEIKRMVDAASVVCTEGGGDEFRCPLGTECPFKDWHGCKVGEIEAVFAEGK